MTLQERMLPETSAKQSILDRIQTCQIPSEPLPEIDYEKVMSIDDPIARFQSSLEFVGGQAHMVADYSDVEPILNKIDVYKDAKRVVSLAPSSVKGTVDLGSISDPHELSMVDWTIATGQFMVAENGAIWIDGSTMPFRVLLFIAQYQAIVVPRKEIVPTMHHAYERLQDFDSRFGIFVSGPSKTADIEQSLVLGAHGCRKLQVFIVG